MSLLQLKHCKFTDITMKNCKAVGLNWSLSSKPFSINIYSSDISNSTFFNLDLRHSKIISCKAHDIDFAEANLTKANLDDTDLLNARFINTNLRLTNLTKAKNYSIDPSSNKLNSTKVALPEALSFLNYLNIKVST